MLSFLYRVSVLYRVQPQCMQWFWDWQFTGMTTKIYQSKGNVVSVKVCWSRGGVWECGKGVSRMLICFTSNGTIIELQRNKCTGGWLLMKTINYLESRGQKHHEENLNKLESVTSLASISVQSFPWQFTLNRKISMALLQGYYSLFIWIKWLNSVFM